MSIGPAQHAPGPTRPLTKHHGRHPGGERRAAGELDREVVAIAWLSLRVSLTAVLFGALVGVPLGALIAVVRFPGRQAVIGPSMPAWACRRSSSVS